MLSEQQEFATPPSSSGTLRWLLLAVLALLTVMVVASRVWRSGQRQPPHPAVGKKLEHLALQPLTGGEEPLVLDDLAGKVSLINIWGTWCGPCVIEFPHLVELEAHYRGQSDFRFVSVSCSGGRDDSRLAKNTAAFLQAQQADFPTFADPTIETRDAIAKVAGEPRVPYPTTLILGRDGVIRGLWFGYDPEYIDEMREVIDAALAEKQG